MSGIACGVVSVIVCGVVSGIICRGSGRGLVSGVEKKHLAAEWVKWAKGETKKQKKKKKREMSREVRKKLKEASLIAKKVTPSFDKLAGDLDSKQSETIKTQEEVRMDGRVEEHNVPCN